MAFPPEHTEAFTTAFFSWHRRRIANLSALASDNGAALLQPGASWRPETHVVLSVALDSLANYWGSTFFKARFKSDGDRMVAFLRENAQSSTVFDRVMGPFLRRAFRNAGAEQIAAITAAVSDFEEDGRVRFAHDDPILATVLDHPAVVAARIAPEQVERWSWARFFYKEVRCHWVHRFTSSKLVADDPPLFAAPYNQVPRYSNIMSLDEAAEDSHPAVFPFSFLLNVYTEALETFERRCRREGRAPWHDDQDVDW